jgi:hypothetical protein
MPKSMSAALEVMSGGKEKLIPRNAESQTPQERHLSLLSLPHAGSPQPL